MLKTFAAGVLLLSLLFLLPRIAPAQTTGNTDHPQAYLAAPADPVAYYRKITEAERLLAQRKWAEAETLLREVTSAYPLATGSVPNHSPWGELGISLQQKGKYADAIDAYKKVIALQGPGLAYPGVSNALYEIASSYVALGNREAALQALKLMVETDAYVARPELLDDPAFAILKTDPRFRAIAGAENLSRPGRIAGWRRDIDYMVAELKRVNPTGEAIPSEFYLRVNALKAAVPSADVLRRVGAAESNESPMEVLWTGPEYLVRPAVLKGLGTVKQGNAADLTLKMPDGTIATRTIHAGAEPPPDQWRRKLNPPPNAKAPLWLENTKRNHWFKALAEQDALYAQVNNIDDDPDETMMQFGIELRQALAEAKVHNLILDLRHNNGGNTFHYIELLRTAIAFSTNDDNRVYVLIGRSVYSAAANLSSDLERLARPVFVGEPTSGTGNQYGDESMFVLPYSKLVGAHSGARWQLSHPWDKRRSITPPQVPVQVTAKAYLAGDDPVLDTVFRLITDAHSKPTPGSG